MINLLHISTSFTAMILTEWRSFLSLLSRWY